ncbi:hypothetical protein [Streptomyces xanthophaeus]|uniref:hypothetical protein n=1 Tax=Streptomyces xanthophaeus TaxID=67385 RepID=UPI003713901D
MFVVRTPARSAAVDADRREFGLLGKRQGGGLALARPAAAGGRFRAVLDLEQDDPGARSRALLGGEFVPGEGDRLAWRVRCWESVRPAPRQGLLPGPLLPGLPEGLDEAVLGVLRPVADRGALPAGHLVIDRAGYGPESSPDLFGTAAELLLHVLLAGAFGSSADPLVTSWTATGRVPGDPEDRCR